MVCDIRHFAVLSRDQTEKPIACKLPQNKNATFIGLKVTYSRKTNNNKTNYYLYGLYISRIIKDVGSQFFIPSAPLLHGLFRQYKPNQCHSKFYFKLRCLILIEFCRDLLKSIEEQKKATVCVIMSGFQA